MTGPMRRATVFLRHPHGERGSVTAEFAAVVPAVILVLAFCLGALQVLTQQLRLTDAAADAARALARGDGERVANARLQRVAPGASLAVNGEGEYLCAVASSPAVFEPAAAAGLIVRGRGCALRS